MDNCYEIKDKNGKVIFTTNDSHSALGYYHTVRNETGYAEAWYKGSCFFKTK